MDVAEEGVAGTGPADRLQQRRLPDVVQADQRRDLGVHLEPLAAEEPEVLDLERAELGRRLAGTGVTTYSLHPGAIASDVWREVPFGVRHVMKLFMRSTTEGARTSLYCATSPDVGDATGRYYDECREKRPSRVVTPELAAELWERSEAWVAAG